MIYHSGAPIASYGPGALDILSRNHVHMAYSVVNLCYVRGLWLYILFLWYVTPEQDKKNLDDVWDWQSSSPSWIWFCTKYKEHVLARVYKDISNKGT